MSCGSCAPRALGMSREEMGNYVMPALIGAGLVFFLLWVVPELYDEPWEQPGD